jgi:hypothetical protein
MNFSSVSQAHTPHMHSKPYGGQQSFWIIEFFEPIGTFYSSRFKEKRHLLMYIKLF